MSSSALLYLQNLTVPASAPARVYIAINKRRGKILKIKQRRGTHLVKILAHLPVMESFGFADMLRKTTGGHSFPRMRFSHWSIISGDPFKEGSKANSIVMAVRKRKGLREVMTEYGGYSDRW